MQFSTLLGELITAGKVQKQALSQALAYSPSEISKYLSGARLPTPASSQVLIDGTAAYFAGVFWESGLGEGFGALFPMQIPFRNKQELEQMLKAALTAAFRFSTADADSQQARRITSNLLLTDWPDIVQAMVLAMSAAARVDKRVHTYYSLDIYLSLLKQRSLPLPASDWRGMYKANVLITPLIHQDAFTMDNLALLFEHWRSHGNSRDFRLFESPGPFIQPAVFVPNHFAVMLINSLPDTPVAALMRSGRFLMEYELYNAIIHSKPCSYTMEEAAALLESDDGRILSLLEECEAIFAFDSVAFFARKEHLQDAPGSNAVKEKLLKALSILLSRPIPMLVTAKAVELFSSTGSILVPLLGEVVLTARDSVSYMQKYEDILHAESAVKVHVTRHHFIASTFLVLKDHVVVILPLGFSHDQHILMLPRAACQKLIGELYSILRTESSQVTPDLWNHYIRHLPHMRDRNTSLDK